MGSKEAESARNIQCEPVPETRRKWRINDSHILKVEGSVYGLRSAT